jgi:glycosyltransferase involved in cell wall biosynthesis
MKILILTDNFLPSLGGVERHTFTLARYLSTLSHEVNVVTKLSSANHQVYEMDKSLERTYNIKVFRILPMGTRLPFYSAFKYILECRNIVKYINDAAEDYEVVHYHGTHQLFLRFAKSERPIITTVHGVFPTCILQSSKSCKKRSIPNCVVCDIKEKPEHFCVLPVMLPYYFLYYEFMKESLKKINKVICVSEYVRKHIKRFINLDNLITVYNFIDFEGEIKPKLTSSENFDIRSYLNLPSNAKIITYFGGLSYHKGVDLLIKAFGRVRKRAGDNVYLLIGGDGPQKMQLKNLAQGVGNVIFTGFIPRKIQLAIMAQSDAFVHPARYPDACPTTILEAMALGLPIIATKVGGVPELVVKGKSGILVDLNNVYDLSNSLLELLLLDGKKIKDISTFNMRRARNFDIKYVGNQIVKIYREALSVLS